MPLRVDVWRMCMITRRPEPRTAEDIGEHRHIYTYTTRIPQTNDADPLMTLVLNP